MDTAIIVLPVLVVSAMLGVWVSLAKRRSPIEGVAFGLLLGPIGVLVVALLPAGDRKPSPVGPRLSVDDEGLVAGIADRLRAGLDDADPAWSSRPYPRQRDLLRPIERDIVRDLGLSPTRGGDLLAPARRAALRREG